MKVKVRTSEIWLSIPVPLGMAGAALRMVPESVFEKMRKDVPEPYNALVTKPVIQMLCEDCIDILKENKGLEIVHVEAVDGTFVSIRL